jgi:hypothetical protein
MKWIVRLPDLNGDKWYYTCWYPDLDIGNVFGTRQCQASRFYALKNARCKAKEIGEGAKVYRVAK